MGNSGEGINGSVGGLIWVRQRNGSWWPGKILDPDELPESSLPSPRLGTPVKLLGKEGSNVGWYNLEKSKRVKAFRYDQDKCIRKFKASKHAKKGKAVHILELELESARLGKNPSDHESSSAFYPSEESEDLDKNSIRFGDDSGSGSKKCGKSRVLNESEENVSRCTRGLQDLGINIRLLPHKGKRTAITNNREISKKKSKRRTLTKVLDSIKMLSPNGDSLLETRELKEKISYSNGVSCDDTLKSEKKENEISNKARENKLFGSLFDASLVAEEKGSSASPTTPDASQNSTQNSLIEIPSSQNKSGSTISAAKGDHPKWQSKGKRSSRPRKSYPSRMADPTTRHLLGPGRAEQNGLRSLPHRQSRFMVNPKYDPSSFSFRRFPGSLHDVPLEAKSGPDRPHCVPYVSLASKLTGRPIMGHPITVDALADGSCREYMTSVSGRLGGGPPHPHRQNGLLSKKTRKLSALAGPNRPGRGVKRERVVGEAKGPLVACVPLGVVFSRLYADLGGPCRVIY